MSLASKHKKLEKNVNLLAIGSFIAVAIGGIVEIAPLFWMDNTIEKVEGMRPYTPLEQAGRNIYVRELLFLPQPDDPPVPRGERYGRYILPRKVCMTTRFNGDRAHWTRSTRVRPLFRRWRQHSKSQSVVPKRYAVIFLLGEYAS